jgi:hypothetical protein
MTLREVNNLQTLRAQRMQRFKGFLSALHVTLTSSVQGFAVQKMAADKRPLKVFPSTSSTASSGQRLCHIMPAGCAHADRDAVPQGDDMRGLPAGTRLTTLAPRASAGEDGVDIMPAGYAWLTRRGIGNPRLSAWKPCGLPASPKDFHVLSRGFCEASFRVIPLTPPGADWEYEIRKAV